jgi:type II secretory pathway pseudopilin PulG
MNKRPGFMLIEIGVVLGLLMIMMGLAMPSLMFIHKQMAHAELEKLYARVCFLRARAIMSNHIQTLHFDEYSASYQTGDSQQKIHLSNHVQFAVVPQLLGPPSNPTHQILSPVTFPHNTLTLYPDGTMQAGAVYLTDSNSRCLYALTIPVGQRSCVRKYRYDTGTWVLLP